MFMLVSIFRGEPETEIMENFFVSKDIAVNAMVDDIVSSSEYNSLDEIVDAANAGDCGFSDDESWVKTKDGNTIRWKLFDVDSGTFALITAGRRELDITRTSWRTQGEAIDMMIADILSATPYKTVGEFLAIAKYGCEAFFFTDSAWATTVDDDTRYWKIVRVPAMEGR